ncbi:hypothetical protein KIPE111705_27665 [Kibdelosporangium persicum]|nr:hypothetical protein [Kibdelosporangium persicum]
MEQSIVSTVEEMIAGLETAYTGEQALEMGAQSACTFGCGQEV